MVESVPPVYEHEYHDIAIDHIMSNDNVAIEEISVRIWETNRYTKQLTSTGIQYQSLHINEEQNFKSERRMMYSNGQIKLTENWQQKS